MNCFDRTFFNYFETLAWRNFFRRIWRKIMARLILKVFIWMQPSIKVYRNILDLLRRSHEDLCLDDSSMNISHNKYEAFNIEVFIWKIQSWKYKMNEIWARRISEYVIRRILSGSLSLTHIRILSDPFLFKI